MVAEASSRTIHNTTIKIKLVRQLLRLCSMLISHFQALFQLKNEFMLLFTFSVALRAQQPEPLSKSLESGVWNGLIIGVKDATGFAGGTVASSAILPTLDFTFRQKKFTLSDAAAPQGKRAAAASI
jgi:hypothetical protein